MFTGLVEELGRVRKISKGADSARISLDAQVVTRGMKLGDSVAVNGVCLTVVEFGSNFLTAQVMAETLARSNLGELQSGSRVNLERALALGDRLGGHLVSGHIDGIGSIIALEKKDIALLISLEAPDHILKYVVEKGSIAIDGISLTVTGCTSAGFQVSLIPHTAALTTLGYKKIGDTVNLEADLIGKYVERLLGRSEQNGQINKSGLNLNKLAENGFLDY
ncbi:MAG: riboflavin synthase [Clostridia bacterium]|nr:riboflavin synthase [Clostridia bacterium]